MEATYPVWEGALVGEVGAWTHRTFLHRLQRLLKANGWEDLVPEIRAAICSRTRGFRIVRKRILILDSGVEEPLTRTSALRAGIT